MGEFSLFSVGLWSPRAIAELVALVIALGALVGLRLRHLRDKARSQERLDIATQAMGTGLWSLDLRSGKLAWDDRMFTLYGRDSVAFPVAREAWLESLHPDDVAEAKAVCRRAVEGPGDHDTQFRIVRPDGTIRHIRAFARVLLDDKGRPARMVGTNTDITEQAELADRLSRLAGTMPGAVFQLRRDAEGGLTAPVFSGALTVGMGLAPEQRRKNAQALFDGVHPEDRDGLWQSFEHSARDLTVWTYEFRWTGNAGASLWLELRATPEGQLDGSVLWHGFITDLSTRRAAEQQRDALAAVVEASHDIIVIKDLNLRVVATNPAFAAASGHASADDLIGRTDAEIFGLPEDQEPIRTYMADERHAQTLPRGEVIVREEPVVNPDGTVGYLLTRKYPIYDRRNGLIGTGNICVDITRRRAIEAALAQSERRFRDFAETLSDWIWEVDTKGRYTFVAGNVEACLGFRPDEMIGLSIFDLIVIPEPEDLRAVFERGIAEATPIRDYENWNRARDGRLVCILTNGIPILDDDGTVIGYRGTDEDITDRKAAEEEARITQERYIESQLLGRLGHWNLNLRSGEITWSEGLFSIFGLDPTTFAVTYDRLHDLIDPRDRAVMTGAVDRITETGQPVSYFLRLHRADGERIIWNKGYRKTDADGTPTAVFGVTRDVTEEQNRLDAMEEERHKAQELMELAQGANEAKSRFLAGMSHELRTPLNAIMGFSEMMAMEILGPMNSAYKDYSRDILDSARLLLSLIDDILDLARVESGHRKILLQELDLAEEIKACIGNVALKAKEQRLSLRTEIAPDAGRLVADSRAVRQVLLNLLSNAIKFTPPDGHVTVRAIRDAEGWIRLSVEDSGIGIAAHEQARIFDPFSRAHDADQRAIQGTGLGLAMVKTMLELHGGRVMLESKPDQGTLVEVAFPPSPNTSAIVDAAPAGINDRPDALS